jgi:hypothetical protein
MTESEGILAIKCRDLVIDNVRVLDNQTRSAAIALRESRDCRVSHCLVRNYMRVSIDDRTKSLEWGYAFNCTDGTGINVSYSTGTLIEGNRILEENLIPTPEIKAKHKLGDWVKKNPVKGTFINPQTWEAEYTDNWQQGSGLIVTAPKVSDLTRILGNHIENAAQGIDLHSDHVIVSNNVIVNSFMGMKAMHGSRNVLITGNQFIKNCLWAIGLMPGAANLTSPLNPIFGVPLLPRQQASAKTAVWCSMTTAVWPSSTRRWRMSMRRFTSAMCRPMVGSSMRSR